MAAAARRQNGGGGGPRGAFAPAAGSSGRGRHARRFFAATVKHARHARGWTEGAKGAVTAELAATAFDPSDQRFDTWMRAAHDEWWCRAWRCLPFTSCIIKDKSNVSYHSYQ